MDYPLENLGPERFQQLCQALLSREYPQVQCLPVAQPDGGRDAIVYVDEGQDGKFMVFQVKFVRKPLAEVDPHKWILEIVQGELPKVERLVPKGAVRYILVTNVPGTAHPDVGSIDEVNRLLTRTLGIPSICWWRDDLNRRLDNAWSIKWAYPEVMTGPDFLRAIIETGLSEHRERRSSTLRAFLRAQYDMDEEVRFKQVELQNKLLNLFIDVPITLRDAHANPRQFRFFQFEVMRDARQRTPESDEHEQNITRSPFETAHEDELGAATFLLSPDIQKEMPCVVVEGAPGQGKSTIVQYVCQVHRMKLLQEHGELNTIDLQHQNTPARLPVKVDLRDFAAWITKKDPFAADDTGVPPAGWHKSLEAFLAALIAHQSGGTQFSTDDLLAVCRVCSVLLVFDGLDEIADINSRKEIVDEIVRGVQRLEENAASLQVIVTSRPAAFANSPGMPRAKYLHLHLLSLNRQLILAYAERWLRARHLAFKDSSEFRRVLRDKMDQPHLRDLARNPMQLAILLSLLLTRGASLPDKRTALYDYYIDLFFSREAEKSTVVRDHRELLIDIHRYLAWLLQSEAEQGNTQASIAQERLQQVVMNYLIREGHNTGLAKELFTGMVERVVALVSRVEGTFEFEVQPLREYFAACHLYYTAPQSSPGKEQPGSKPDRFDAIVRNFYWLNVTRFYGGCYSKGELPSLVERLQELIKQNEFRILAYPRVVAATLLSDWVFSQNPKSVQQMVDLITENGGLHFFVGSSRRSVRVRGGAPHELVLPAKCGRDELSERCFGMLDEDLQSDHTSRLLDVIRVNCPSLTELAAQWLRHYECRPRKDAGKWLGYGLGLGVLQLISLDDLKKCVDPLSSENDTLRTLYRARRLDYFHSSEEQFEAAVNGLLGRRMFFGGREKVESTLDALGRALDLNRYGMAYRNRQPVPLRSVLDRRERGPNVPVDLFTTARYKSHAACLEIAGIAEEELQYPADEWVNDLHSWNRIVEAGRSLFGEDRLTLLLLANLAAGIRSTAEKCPDAPELFECSKPLVRRARHARLRTQAQTWWKAQLRAAHSVGEKFLALLIALSWASLDVFISNIDEVERILSELNPFEWEQAFYGARNAVFLADPQLRKRYRADVDVDTLPKELSPRAAVIVGNRIQATQRVHRKYLRSYQGNDRIVLGFISEQASDTRHFGSESWKPDLARIRECYGKGSWSDPESSLEYQMGQDASNMPLGIAKEITSAPASFPQFLVASAEERCRQEIAASIVPVGITAEKELWFSLG